MSELTLKIEAKSKLDTNKLGKTIANYAFKNEIITLTGELGAGKTYLVKEIGKNLGIKEEINSPTFNILKCYFNSNNSLNLYHIDAYRLEDSLDKNKDIGIEEVLEMDGVSIIEWPKFIEEFIDFNKSLNIYINFKGKKSNKREFVLKSKNERFNELFLALKREFLND